MKNLHGKSQDSLFLSGEGDAWFRRNSEASQATGDHRVLQALEAVGVGARGSLLDVGGASGDLAAGFLRRHPEWKALVVEPSSEAIEAGRRLFPDVNFAQGTIAEPLPPSLNGNQFDVVVVSGVFCWVDRANLSRAVANVDVALADQGLLVISDFDAPFPRANPYHHAEGLLTYKQDYARCFQALGTYHLELRRSTVHGSAANSTDPYDRHWMTAVLRKDLQGRYARVDVER